MTIYFIMWAKSSRTNGSLRAQSSGGIRDTS